MADLRKIKNVRKDPLPDRNLHYWVISPETESKSCHLSLELHPSYPLQDERWDSSLVSVFLPTNWDDESL